ncbi:MAG TPA: sigma-70 family RNA polymerase sigma factor [Actinomycetota bacterium]|nr:sigma-70 family RNA polymerase sigma factor [Actinomycetota bacterium]
MTEIGELGVAREVGLEALYRRLVGGAEGLARALTGDPYLAQDIAHDAFIRVAGRFGHLRNAGAFEAYLRRAVVNQCRSHFRRAGVERRGLQRLGVRIEASAAHALEERDSLWATIQALPYRQRAAIVLRFYEDLSEAQAGEILRCSPRAVNSLVSRAMATLRAEMEER